MKKILAFLTFTIIFCNTSFAKISDFYYDILVEGCMETALNANHGYKKTRKYCTCTADHLDQNYNDESLVAHHPTYYALNNFEFVEWNEESFPIDTMSSFIS